LSRSIFSRGRRSGVAGFTLIEVLVALVVVSVSLAAIGSLVATTVRGVRAVDRHLALVETARTIVTGLPDRNQISIGSLNGEFGGHRWRVDVLPFVASNVGLQEQSIWLPQAVVVRVQSPAGTILQVNTVRLRRRTE
jgi:general secretion pathway protein I